VTEVVIDASTALAWCFPDEASEYAEGVLVALEGRRILVPAVWGLELANAIAVGERRGRLAANEVEVFLELLENLDIDQDVAAVIETIRSARMHARKYELSAYDAAYLELAIRRGTSLATLDGKMRKAAGVAGVRIFPDNLSH
jgi:predicted nucleic acid-binding protein